MPLTWPAPNYVTLLGKVAYGIAAIEGLLIFDLPRMPLTVPGLTPGDLAGDTTTGIGKKLTAGAAQAQDPAWTAYLERGGDALVDLGPRRNDVLHARPATIDGQQMLHRWRPPLAQPIDVAFLEDLLDRIEAHRKDLTALRPPL